MITKKSGCFFQARGWQASGVSPGLSPNPSPRAETGVSAPADGEFTPPLLPFVPFRERLPHAGEGKQVYTATEVTDSHANPFLPETASQTHEECSPATWVANGLVEVTRKMNRRGLPTEVW